MGINYGTTHQNVINCSSEDWKLFRGFLDLVRSAARARFIRQSYTINVLTDFIAKDVDASEKRAVRALTESVSQSDDIVNVIEEVLDLARQINLEMDSDEVQELLDSHSQELAIDELIEMHEQKQDIEEPKSLEQRRSYRRISLINDTGLPRV
ncbi:hypothetical protein TNCV_239731 [Trichonephila clavipes]|nr:hypothetical protein TNCV_239731 [Trichonephila clavipes]